MRQTPKERYADYISDQIERKIDVLPTFKEWMDAELMIRQIRGAVPVTLESKLLGRVTITGYGIDETDAYNDATEKLKSLEQRYAMQKGLTDTRVFKSEDDILIEHAMKRLEAAKKDADREAEKLANLKKKLGPK